MTRHPRLATYGPILAVIALYGVRVSLHGGTAIGWLAVAVCAIGILHIATARLIREAINYYPSHRIEKQIAGVVSVTGALGVWWGVDPVAFGWCAACLILASEVVTFEFVLFKNAGMGDFLRTIFGLVPVPTRAEALMHAEYTAALWRHELIPVAGREAIEDAQRLPPKSEWLADLRAEIARLREEAARNDRLASEVEIDALIQEGP